MLHLSSRFWLACAIVSPFTGARSQELPAAGHAIEVQVSERRLNGREQSAFTPFQHSTQWLLVDSVRATNTGRALFVRLGGTFGGSGTIHTTAAGHVVNVSMRGRPVRSSPLQTAKQTAWFARTLLFQSVDERELNLPASRVWDLVPAFHPPRLAAGAQWTDSVSFAAESLGNRQRWIGTRTSWLLRDTTIRGAQLWIMRDSAAVQYEELALVDERTLDTLVRRTRVGKANIVGRVLYDPGVGLARMRDDTLRFTGSASLTYPDGRSFTTPTRDERTRHAILYDSAEYDHQRKALRAERERTMSGGAVLVANNAIDQRLSNGDTVLRDSLLQAWRRATTPNEREALYERLTFWGRCDTAFVHRLAEQRIADGDTVFLLRQLATRPYTARWQFGPVDTAHMRQLIAVMSDPGLAFAFQVDDDPFYEDLAQALTTTPPAATADTAKWPCTPAACRLLAGEWPTPTEPRLRQVALVARFALDPRSWTDTLVNYASRQATPPLLDAALLLARGVGSTWPAASKASIPNATADWRAWTEWMNGTATAYARQLARDSTLPAQFKQKEPALRFDQSHAVAIRFTEARTGRDIVAELRRQLAAATTDSARVVYEYILNGLGAYRPTAATVAALLNSVSPASRDLGRREVAALFRDDTPRADSATTDSLQDALIATALQLGHRWRVLDSATPGARFAEPPMREAASEKTFLLADSLSPGLRAKWSSRARIMTQAEWNKRGDREGGTLFTLTSVRRVGPFARLGVASAGRIPRNPEQAPWLYYASTTYYLMQVNGEWFVVSSSGWIT